nr:uncharacterized protein LOC107376896 [Nothobranchius furzeri]
MANHMSNPMKKPYTQGKKISSQGQNELSTQQANEDPSRAVLRLWPGSTFCTPTNLTGIPAMPEKGVPVSSSLPVCDKLETTGTFLAKGSKSTLSICAREETQQPVGHASFFTSTHSHILSSLTTGMTTNPVSSTFQGHKQISVGSDSSSFNCWPNNENASEFSSKFPLNSSDDGPSVEQLVATDLNPQLAVNILMNYGLGEEDLDELLSYPEDQTTAENLPNTLHELRMKKIRRASASPKSYPGVSSQPTFVMDKVGRLDEIPQNSHRPSKVVDPGHSGKCFSEVEDKTDETICQTDKSDKNMLLIDGLKSSGNNNEVPQKRLTEVESSSEMSNIVATPSSNPTKPQTSPNQTSQKVITILSSSDKYKDMLEPRPEVLKSVPSEEPVHHAPSKTVPASSPGQSVNSGHSGVLQVISKDKSFVKSQTKTQQGSNMTEPGNQPIQQKMVQKPSALQIWEALQPAFPFNVKPVPKSFSFPSPSVASHSIQPPVFIGNDPGPSIIYSSQPVSDLSSTSMSRSRQPFLAKNPTFEGLPPLAMMHDFAAVPPRIFPHTCSLCMEECEQMKDWMIHQNTNLHLENCKRFRERYPEWDGELPRFPSALSRSAETPPPTSAHISQHHQKAGHESSCSRSHSPYSSGNRYRKSRSSSSSCSSGYRQHRSRDRRVKSCSSGSRSCSRSPRRRRSRERRAKPHSSISRSCSRSPRRCSSRERRPKPRSSISRSCSRSPRRCSSRERRPKPRSSSSRSRSHSPQRRSPRNRRDKSSSNSRSSSPHRQYRTEGQKGKYGKGPRSPHRAIYRIRSRSASPERQSSPRRTYRKLQHPETLKPRNYKRPSPTSFKQQLSSRRDEEKHLQPKKSDEDSASFKGSRKRRMSLEESSSNKKKLPGIKKLTDLLLENPVVQSLSGKPDIKDVVERMVPFVLAELANNTTSSSLPSSSSSVPSQDKKRNASPSSYGGSNSSFSSKISKKHPTIQKSERSSSSKSKTVAYDKPSPPTIVKLKGVFDLLSHNDVVAAVKPFGKTKSVLLLKSKQEATVCFEKEKNAEKLRSVKSIDVKGVTLTVVPKRGSVPKSVSPASTEDQIKQTKEKSTVPSESCSAEKLVLLQGTSPVYLPAEPKPTTSFKKKKKVLATKGKDEVAVKRAVKDGKEEDGCSGVKLKNPAKVKKNLIVTKAKRNALKSHKTVQTATVMKKRRVKTANSAEAEKSMKVELSRSQSLIGETAEEAAVPSEPTSSINQPDGSRTPITDNITEPLLVRQVSIPDSSAENPTVDPKTSGSSASAALEPPLIVIEVHTKTNPTDAIAHGAETKPTMKTTEQAPATVATFTPETFLTIGDKIEWYLSPHKFNCVTAQSILSSGVFTFDSTLLLITNLPEKALFTEADLVNLLSRFGLENEHDNIYIFPQLHMAFALMPNEHSVRSILKASVNNHLFFRQNKLFLHVVKNDILMTPLWFYKALMSLTPLGGKTNGQNLVYIRNISPSEVQDLREVLKKIGSVTNFLPLLNKVFIEFKSMHDADRLGVWYSFLKRGFTHIVHRLKTPQSNRRTKCPELPMNALPDKKLIIPGADVPNAKYGIPHGTTPPFWITMTTIPYVFSTACPWFNVPDFLTIQGKQDRVTNHHPGSGYCTVMLTGLPEGNYTHEDVARLVWRYFPKKNLQTLYYNILVLPLQRRAFVYFCSQEACCRFVRFHIKRPLVLCNVPLQVHFVLQDLRHEPREEIMYRVLMKWSNSYVPELNFLENRLLCVELSEVNMDLIWRVIKEVATMSCFLNFLPLANRICIEMVESSGVKKVLDEIDQRGDLLTHKTWAKVRHVESLNGLKQRLRDTSEITLNLERDNGAKPKTGAQPRLSDEAKADSEKPATSDTSMVSQSEAVLQKSPAKVSASQKRPERGAAEPSKVSTFGNEPEERTPEASRVSKSETKSDKQSAIPSNVPKSIGSFTLKFENKSGEVEAEMLNTSQPEIMSKNQPAKPSNVPKSDNKPQMRAKETTKASLPDKPAMKPSNVCKSVNKPEERAAEPPTISKSENRPEEGVTETLKAPIPDKPAPKPSNVCKSQDKQEGPLRASKPEVLPNSQSAKPSNIPKPQNKPAVRVVEMTTASEFEVNPYKPATKPSNVSKSENQPEVSAAEPTKAFKPQIKPDEQAKVSKSESKSEGIAIEPSCGSTSKNKQDGPSNVSKSEIILNKPAMKPSNVSKSQNRQEGPLRASKSEVLPNSQSAKPSNVPKSDNKPQVRAKETTKASLPDKPATKPSIVCKSVNKPEERAAEPPTISKSENRPEEGVTETLKAPIPDKPAPKPSNVCKSQDKQEGPLRASKPEVLPNSQSAKPSNIPKPQNKPAVRVVEMTKASEFEVNPYKPATKPSNVSKSENQPEVSTDESTKAFKPQIKPDEQAKVSKSESKTEGIAIEPSCGSTSKNKQDGPSNVSKSEIILNKPTTKPSNVSKSENKPEVSTAEPTKAFKPQIKPDEQAKVSKSESKSEGIAIEPSCGSTSKNKQDRPSNVSKSEIILNKPATKPLNVSKSEIILNKPSMKPSNVSKSENKPEVSTAEPTKAFKPQIKPDEQAKVSKPESKSEGIAIEPSCGSASKNKQDGPSNVSKSEIILNKPATKPLNVSKSEIILNKPSMKPSNVSKSENKPEVSTAEPTKAFKPQIKPDEQAKVSKPESKTEGIAIEPSCGSTSKNKQDGPSNVSKSESILNEPATKPLNVSKSEIILNKPAMKPSNISKSEIILNKPAMKPSNISKSEIILNKPAMKPSNISKSEIILNKPATEPLNVSKSEIILNKPATNPSNVSISETKPKEKTGKPSILSSFENKPGKEAAEAPRDAKPEVILDHPSTKPPEVSLSAVRPKESAPETPKASKWDQPYSKHLNVCKSVNDPEKRVPGPPTISTSDNKSEERLTETPKAPVPDKPATKPSNISKYMIKPEVRAAESTKLSKPQIRPNEQSVQPLKASKSESKTEGMAVEHLFGSKCENKQEGPSKSSETEAIFNKAAAKLPDVPSSMVKPEDSAPETPKASRWDQPVPKHLNVCKSVNKPEERAPEPPTESEERITETPKPVSDKPATKPSNVSKSMIKPEVGAAELTKVSKPEIKSSEHSVEPLKASKSESRPEGTAMEPLCGSKPENKQEGPPKVSMPEIIFNKPAAKPSDVSKSGISVGEKATEPSTVYKPEAKPKETAGEPLTASSFEDKPGKGAAEVPRVSKPEFMPDKPSTAPSDVSTSTVKPEAKQKAGEPRVASSFENKPEKGAAEVPRLTKPEVMPDKPSTAPSHASKSEIRLKEKAVEPPSVCKPEAVTGGKAPVPQETLLSSKAETTGVTPPGQLFTETRAAAGPVAIPKTQSDSASNAVSNASASSPVSPAAPAAVRKQPAAASTPSVTELTVGERIGSLLVPQKISCINRKAIQSLNVTPRLCLITKLPTHRYTEDDVVQLLQKFGFEYEDKNIYVIPQARMAFALMPSFESAKGLFMVPRHNLNIGGFQLDVDIVSSGILMTPFEFYKSLMEKMDHKVADDGESTIYIQNIDSDEAGALRETLKRIKCVKNYLPLLNKVFVEFESVRDADRIGVWYSLRKHCPPHIFRMKMPRSTSIAPAPRLAANALPDSEDLVSGVIAPTTNFGVPPGSLPPFSVTLLTYPFVFPTLSPWFIIPPFLSVERQKGVWVSVSKFNRLSTVMLTGLPEGNYRHEDVAKLVWQHFPNKNLQTLFYNILVLPLQRRAFVYFGNHSACTSFVHNSLKNPLSIKGNKLSIHLVPQRMGPRECEEAMYTTMMKWSNAHVPKLGSLSERLLCLELYETSVQLIIALMKKVTDIAPIVSFLPLANRLCIEMSEPSGVTTVLEKIAGSRADWCRVRRAESCESLRQRLQDCSGITVDLDQDTEGVDVLKSGPLLHPARLPEKTPQLAPQGPAPRHLHVPAPKEQNASATQTPQTSSQKTAVMGGNEKTEQTAVKTLSAPSTSGLEKQPDAPGKGQSEVVLQDTIGASGRRNETAPGIKEPAEPVKAEPEEVKVQSKEVKETKSVELVKREAPENVEVKGSAAVCEGLTPTTPPEPPTGPPQRPLTTLKPQQTSVKASSEVQKPVEPNPESTTQKLETTTAASREQQQKTGNSDLVEAGINPTSKAVKVSAVAPEKTSSAQTESKQQSAAAGSQKQMNPTTSSAPNLHLTPGEKLKEYQALDKLRCTSLKYPTIFSEHVSSIHICLAITNLSKFNNGCYTEADIIKLLQKYEIQCEENKLFVLPHIHMAFVLFPDVSKVQTLFKVSEQVKAKSVVLKGSELSVFAFSLPNKSFLSFYEFLKRLATFKKRKGPRDKTSIVYVWSISQSEAAHLRQALRKIGGLMNYQPMLNKVLVEFLTSLDADRFGIWCSFLKPCFSYSVFRMGVPCPNTPNVLPSLSVLALSDRDVTVAGASSPSSPMGIPVGTGTTFWVTMTTNPYVYPTGLPLFNIPAFRTVTPRSQIKHLEPVRLYRLKVIMLTGLPPNIYTQEDFAKLVWKHFPEENLDPLDNNVMFLPLQRRAFVYFSGWEACFSFLESYIRNPFYKRNYKLCVHYVLDNIFLNTNEETVYRVLMKWSNSYVSDVKSLGERLLCVEVSGRGIPFVCTVMKRVASIATFVSFLPLANRIYIEMAESSGVTKVVGTLSASKSSEQCETWKQVGRVESLKSRKLRLQDSKRTAVNLELSNVGVHSESTADKEAPKTGWDHAELGSLVLDPAAATGLSSTAMEEERRETEVPVCSITDLGTAEEKKEESVTSSSPSPTSLAQPQADLPPIDSSSFRALKEVIHLYKLHHSKQVQEATKDVRSSEVCDKTDLNFENFITIDEINEDEVDKDVSPSSKPTSRDSEEASKPTSSSPSSTDASPSSTELQKHPLEPNKSQTNPSSSANNTSPFVPSSKSVEPSVSPGLKAQPIRAKTPKRASQALPTGRVTRSSAAAVKTSVETLRSHQKEGEPPGGAMAEASAESSTETSDIRPPSPRDKLETVLKDVKTRKEKDEGKSTEVTEKSEEDDLVISSLDEQMNKVSNEETQKPRSEGDQVSQNECLHVSEVNKDQICSEIKNAKHESATAQQEEGSPPKPDQAMEENQNVPVNQDESQTEDGEKVKDFQEESVPKMSARRSSRGTKGLKTSPDKVTIVTRSTRGRRTMTAEESEDGEKNGKEKETPTRPGRTLGRNEQQLNNEDTPKVKDITPTNKTNTDGDTDGPKTSLEVSGESEEETKQAASPRKRGRPRKTTTVASPVLNKKIAELVEPEAKRSRSRSPRVSADFKLPPFSPDKPLGTEFVSRKWGYFCNLCSVSYMSEGATGDQHCRSQTHAENLQRYQQALERKSRISTRKTF